MNSKNDFFRALGVSNGDKKDLNRLSRLTGIRCGMLKYYNDTNTLPSGADLEGICSGLGLSSQELMLKMGKFDRNIVAAIQRHSDRIFDMIKDEVQFEPEKKTSPLMVFETEQGKLYQGDCLDLMATLPEDSVDLIFADPPFNLNKLYPSKIDDNLKEEQYLGWCEQWADECIRILKPGGSLFVWNLPKWNTRMAAYLNGRLTFRHWIATDIKYTLPIPGRLYPSHYSLIYYCKGKKPTTFHPDRLPMEICPHCMGDLRDYGGYKHKMNPSGVNMTDVWFDIPPVRHAKYKKRKNANELSVRLLDRIIEIASDETDLVFDPFGGSGTTYVVSEMKKRRWIGIEIGPVEDIIARLADMEGEADYLETIRKDYNNLFTDRNLRKRQECGMWTPESVRKKKLDKQRQKSLFTNNSAR